MGTCSDASEHVPVLDMFIHFYMQLMFFTENMILSLKFYWNFSFFIRRFEDLGKGAFL